MEYRWAFDDAAVGRPPRLGDNVWRIEDGRPYVLGGEEVETFDDDDWDDDDDNYDGEDDPW